MSASLIFSSYMFWMNPIGHPIAERMKSVLPAFVFVLFLFWVPSLFTTWTFHSSFFCWQEKHPSYTVLKTTHFSGLYCFKKTWIGPLLYNMWDKHHWRTAVLLPSEKIFGLFCLWPGTNILEGNDPELVLHLSDANFHIHLPMGKL